MSSKSLPLFASCLKGLELLLLEELQTLGAEETRETVAGVFFSAPLEALYNISLWSRLAGRITLPLLECSADSIDELDQAVSSFAWEEHLDISKSILVNFSGTNHLITNTQFGAQKVKDGIVDRMRAISGARPDVEKTNPDIRIQAQLNKGLLRIAIDLCGTSLQNRLYNESNDRNALQANLAAALLIRCKWPELSKNKQPFYDLHCNSGTLLIEAAMISANIAPGLYHGKFGFESWLKHDQILWQNTLDQAQEKKQQGLENTASIIGFDQRGGNIADCKSRISKAGLSEHIQIQQMELKRIPVHNESTQGLVLSALPSEDHNDNDDSLKQLYQEFGDKLKQEFLGWQAGIFTENPSLARQLNIRARKKYKFLNNLNSAQLMLFDVNEKSFYARDAQIIQQAPPPAELSEGALMFANRIKKNQKQLNKWLKKNQISCFRLYDADMPEYAVAIDIFTALDSQRYAHVQEYAAPKTIDPDKVTARFADIQAALPGALDLPQDNIFYKEKRRQKEQYVYGKKADTSHDTEVQEGPAKLLINLQDHVDIGLFLDQRPLRQEVAAMSKGLRILNLFCYTASSTVQSALAGASASVSVDLSKTYLDWASRNFALNGINKDQHELVHADCFQWLKNATEKFDLILLDPPAYSSSKRMESVLELQRDHIGLIKLATRLLEEDGTLIFISTLRNFTLDIDALHDFDITNISAQTLDRDFQRNKKTHQCWLISKFRSSPT